MEMVIDHKTSVATGELTSGALRLATEIEGRKEWLKGKSSFRFTTTEHNLRLMQEIFPDIALVDKRGGGDVWDFGQGSAQDPHAFLLGEGKPKSYRAVTSAFPFVHKPFTFQGDCFERFKDESLMALFAEQGTGKTKMMIDIIGWKSASIGLKAVLIVTKRGVHHQWIEEQLPEHMPPSIPWKGISWDRKTPLPHWFLQPGATRIFSINIDALRFPKGWKEAERFCQAFSGSLMILVDESQIIKNPESKNAQALFKLRRHSISRAILTGTPIARDLTDEWGQFLFLDEGIIGIRYKATFMKEYCRVASIDVGNGHISKTVTGYKSLPRFNKLTAPYIFRATKIEDLGLPPKTYKKVWVDLTDEQARHQQELKADSLTRIDSGEVATVESAATLITRLQQLACGYLLDEDGTLHHIKSNRLDALVEMAMATEDKKVIWCRFNQDIELIMDRLGEEAVSYFGKTPDRKRKENKAAFINDPAIKFFVGSPAAAGTGVDGLQRAAHHAYYYSNSFNAIDRWQSEDRIDRIGMGKPSIYTDIVARGSVDLKILANLRAKKSFSDLMMDDVRRLIEELT
jgi:hypothetical protein